MLPSASHVTTEVAKSNRFGLWVTYTHVKSRAHRFFMICVSYWDAAAHGALGRLARHHGLTRRATLEALVLEAEGALLKGKPLNERQSYYNGGG